MTLELQMLEEHQRQIRQAVEECQEPFPSHLLETVVQCTVLTGFCLGIALTLSLSL